MAVGPSVERRGSGGWGELLATERAASGPGAEWHTALYETAVEQFARAADALDLDADMRARLLEPRRALVLNFPVRAARRAACAVTRTASHRTSWSASRAALPPS